MQVNSAQDYTARLKKRLIAKSFPSQKPASARTSVIGSDIAVTYTTTPTSSVTVDPFTVSGGTGGISWSNDGATWVAGTWVGTAISNVRAIGWNGTSWLAGGSGGTTTLATSPDGKVWTAIENSKTSVLDDVRGIAWGAGKWVITGLPGAGQVALQYSSNGTSWTPVTGAGTYVVAGWSITWNGSYFLATGSSAGVIAYSTDGVTWQNSDAAALSAQIRDAEWNGTKWIAVGAAPNYVLTSTNGLTWSAVAGTPFSILLNGVAWNGSQWVVVCESGGYSGGVYTSPDGIVFTVQTTTGGVQFPANVVWNGTYWIVTGSGGAGIMTSTNGITWTPRTSNSFGTNGISVMSRNIFPITATVAGTTTTRTCCVVAILPRVRAVPLYPA